MSEGKASGRILGTILLTVFLDLVGFSIIFPLFPDMLEYYLGKEAPGSSFHALILRLESLSGMTGAEARLAATVLFGGLLGSLYSLLQFLAAPVWGAWSDRKGRRGVLLITVGGTALSYLFWVSADAFWLLVASRLLGGVMAGNLSVATAAVADVTDSTSRTKGMGLIGAAFGVGFIVGPALGALLSRWDLQSTLAFVPGINPFSAPALVAFFLSAINLFVVIRLFPETLSDRAIGPGHAKRPMNPMLLFRPSPFTGVNRTNLLYFIFIAAFAGMEFTLTFLAKDRFSYDAYQNGRLFLFIGFIIVVVQGGVVRRLTPRFGERRVTIAGLVMIVPGLVIVGLTTERQVWMYAGLFLLATGSSLATPSLTALVSLYTPDDRQGETLGLFRSFGSLARAVAPIGAAIIYWRFGSAWPYVGSAAILLIPIALAVGLPAPPAPPAPQPAR